MKNKTYFEKLLVAMTLTCIMIKTYLSLSSFTTFPDLLRQVIFNGALLGLVLLMSRQNQDDDDWAY